MVIVEYPYNEIIWGLILSSFFLVFLVVSYIIQWCIFWVNDNTENMHSIVIEKMMNIIGYHHKEEIIHLPYDASHQYISYDNGQYKFMDASLMIFIVTVILIFLPLMVSLYIITIPILLLVFLMHIARFGMRTYKKLMEHCENNTIHNKE